jgi:signal transduction histidine kinase
LQNDLFGGLGGLSFVVLSLAFATVGVLIVARVPGNAVGWTFVAIGVIAAVGILAEEYGRYALTREPALPGGVAAAWLTTPLTEALPGLFGLAPMLFPDGRLPSARWRAAAAVPVACIVLLVASGAFAPGPLDDPFAAWTNPLGWSGGHDIMVVADAAGWALAVAGIALGAASAVVRLRRARGVERQQLKLVLSVGTLVAVATTLVMSTWVVWPHGGLQLRMAVIGLLFAAFAVAAGIAVLRYRLYDVDAVVGRALVYSSLTLLLAAAYGLTTLVLGRALGGGSNWATAGATLAVAVAFRPLRGWLQDTVDRRLGRARYEARRRVQTFLEELRAGRARPEEIEPLLRELLDDPALELRFFLPESALYVDAAGAPVRDAPGDTRVRTPVERAGAPLALVLHRPGRPDLLTKLVETGGLAIEIARLRVELRRQLAEVEASRARIVAAGYAERRRIERDLHDGAQQRLVSIGLALRHAQHQLDGAAPERAGATLDRAVSELSAAIAELRELAHGLPPAQLDAGLEPALKELAGRAPLPVEVRATGERFTVGLEAAAYFVACEGLTNAIKHAQATGVVLSARRENGSLVVSVADDGVGGAAAGQGSGLRGLHDRVAAHGGRLHIASASQTGTILTAELPCES